MCNKVVRRKSYTLRYVPDQYKTQEMCEEAMPVRPVAFFLIPDHSKTQLMRDKTVELDPDWFDVLQEMWHEVIMVIIMMIILLNGMKVIRGGRSNR